MPSTTSIQNEIIQQANAQGVPSSIALRVAQEESGFNPNAVGSSGELGVFQLLPSSFPGQPIDDLDSNISIGISYLKQLYNQFGDWATAIAAYNAGPTRVANGNIPASTQNYVQSVLSNAGGIPPDDSGSTIDAPVTDLSATFGLDSISPDVLVPAVIGGAALLIWLLD